MRSFLLAGVLLGIAFCTSGQPREALQHLIAAEGLKNAAVGISVKQVSDGKTVVEYNPQMALAPASVTKLLSTAFALDEKGSDFRYQTGVFYGGEVVNGVLEGDLVIEPGGDPSLESSYFKENKFIVALVNALLEKGIKRIKGKIQVDVPESAKENIPGTWLWEDISNYYGASYLPFNYRDNFYTLELRSGEAGTQTKIVRVVPEVPGVTFRNEVRASGRGGDNAWIYGGPYSPVRYIRGTIPENRSVFRVKGAMSDPARCFINELEAELALKGINVDKGKMEDGKRTKLLMFTSPALEDIVFFTNKSSVNLFAEALGQLAVKEKEVQEGMSFLLQKAGIDATGMTLKDACGLSPLNGVPARIFTDLLIWAHKKLGVPFEHSLPVAGADGCLNGYYGKNALLNGKLKAKTGSFSGVRCLSGYLTTRSGKQMAFTVLINHYTCSNAELQKSVGLFLGELAES